MKKIIVVGYPKSGNTWITRLVAELVGCPVNGFWNQPTTDEIAVEGLDRESQFECFKSHYTFDELKRTISGNDIFIINVIRDPRDIVISGAHYFEFHRFFKLYRLLKNSPTGLKIYNRTIYKVTDSMKFRIEKMIETILYGRKETHHFCRYSWKDFITPYIENNIQYIRYEDMLMNADSEILNILKFLNISRSSEDVDQAIKKQSFDTRKLEFLKEGDKERFEFLREGRVGQWRTGLKPDQKQIVWKNVADSLQMLGYPEK